MKQETINKLFFYLNVGFVIMNTYFLLKGFGSFLSIPIIGLNAYCAYTLRAYA